MKNVRKKSENIRWKLWILSAGIALLLMAGGVRIHKLKEEKYELQNRLEREVQQNIAKEVLRFHVIANSDTKEDQKLKMQVKTELLEYMNGFLKESDGLEETKEIVLGHLTEIKQTAKEIWKKVVMSIEWKPKWRNVSSLRKFTETVRFQKENTRH